LGKSLPDSKLSWNDLQIRKPLKMKKAMTPISKVNIVPKIKKWEPV